MIDRRQQLLAATLAVLVLVLALGGCGSSDDGTSTSDPTTSSSSGSMQSTGSTQSTVSAPTGSTSTLVSPTGPFADGRTPLTGFGEIEVRIVESPDGEPIVVCVLVAETPEQRQRGLMEVTDLGGYDGMLFVFPTDTEGGFWMKDTLLPLSIAYLDDEGAVVSTTDMEPCPDGTDCPNYPADGPYRMALEVAQGGLAALGLTDDSPARLELSGPCAPLSRSD